MQRSLLVLLLFVSTTVAACTSNSASSGGGGSSNIVVLNGCRVDPARICNSIRGQSVIMDNTGLEGDSRLVEQRPRAQSRGETIALDAGEGIIFVNRYRPAAGTRGFHRVNMRHGVSTIRSGIRYAMGIIFHDAT